MRLASRRRGRSVAQWNLVPVRPLGTIKTMASPRLRFLRLELTEDIAESVADEERPKIDTDEERRFVVREVGAPCVHKANAEATAMTLIIGLWKL